MTSGRSDDCMSLRRGLIATATVESPRPQAMKESDPASACQSAHPTQHYDERSLRRLQELAIQQPRSLRTSTWGGHFTVRGHMAENGTRGFREDHGDD
jgi:hypothetical protein